MIFTNPGTRMVQNYNAEPIVATLESGGLILYPTDTIWAIGCDATDEQAVARVIALKEWDYSLQLVLLASSIEMIKQYVKKVHPRVETLLAFHTRPLTVVYDKGMNLPLNVLGKDGSVAFRIPNDKFCMELLRSLGKPIVATSAHIGEAPYPKHFGEISSAVIQGVDLVVKYRQLEKEMGPPSVIARLSRDEELVFLRE